MLDEEPDLAGPPDGLGVMVHGPVVIARAPGIAMGLRCIFGYPSGLSLLMVLRATGVQAEAASRHFSFGYGQQPGGPGSSSRLLVSVDVDGRLAPIDPLDEETTSDADAFVQESTYWVNPLPRDGELSLAVGWPQAGLPEQRLRLTLADLDDLTGRVLPLP